MADTLALGASGATHGGSSPLPGTLKYCMDKENSPKVIFQNREFIVIDKPAGLAVHPGVGIEEKTLVDFLVEKFPEISNVGDEPGIRPGIVHRLDRDTSGVMIVARNQKMFEYLKNLFKERRVEKKYIALVHEKMKEKEGEIEGEMGRSKKDFRKQSLVRGKVRVRKERYSLTIYKKLKEFDKYSLLEVYPKTGRMHQIRVHLHSIGHPIVGDKKYTFKKYKKLQFPGMYLHSASVSFQGADGKQYFFESSLPRIFGAIS